MMVRLDSNSTAAKRLLETKTIARVDDQTPNLRIVFTDGSVLHIEAVACGDLRYGYEAGNHAQKSTDNF
jgi:hypothetical protein